MFGLFCIIYAVGLNLIGNDIVLFAFSIVVTVAVSFLYNYKWYIAVLISVIFSVISGASELIVMQITSMISKEAFEVANGNLYTYVFGLLATKMFNFAAISVIRKGKHKSFQGIGNMRFTQLMLLPIATVLIAIVFSIYINSSVTSIVKIAGMISLLTLISANVMTFYIVDAQQELIGTKSKLKASQLLLENQRQYYDEIFRSQKEIRKTRHDLKNIFIAVLGELNDGKIDETKIMIEKKLNEVQQTINVSNEEKSVVEAIIYAKKNDASNLEIELKTNISINREIQIDKLDLAVLVANLLDNAIEATNTVKENRIIEFLLITDNDNLIIYCKNPTINSVDVNRIKTTKKDSSNHGFGIISIRSVAEKYNGNYVMEYNNVFSGTVVMANKSI